MSKRHQQLFGFHDIAVPASTELRMGVSGADPVPAPAPVPSAPPVPLRFYALTVPIKGGAVKVLEYEHTPEGHHQLVNLIRGERVIRVVFGREVKVEASSVVDLELDGTVITDKLPLPE